MSSNSLKKIVVISPTAPQSHGKGFQIQLFHRLLYLADKFDISLVYFDFNENNISDLQLLSEIGIKQYSIRYNYLYAGLHIIKSIFSNTPFQCALFNSKKYSSLLQSVFLKEKPDLLIANTIRVFDNFNRLKLKVPYAVELVDSMGLNFERKLKNSLLLKPIFLIESKRVLNYERRLANQSICSFTVSSIDQGFIKSGKVKVVPIGIERLHVVPPFSSSEDTQKIIFTGNMSYEPNVIAVHWFVKNCWNTILKMKPNLEFWIVGNRPSKSILELRKLDNIYVTGKVPSVLDEIKTSSLAIAPMQSGSGMQFKIIEALGVGTPVVTTSLGKGDIQAKSDDGLLIADTPLEFVSKIIFLLENKSLRFQLGLKSHQFILDHHTWDSVNSKWHNLILHSYSQK